MKAGLEIGFLKERIHLQFEAYHRKGMDLVTKVAVPVTYPVSGSRVIILRNR